MDQWNVFSQFLSRVTEYALSDPSASAKGLPAPEFQTKAADKVLKPDEIQLRRLESDLLSKRASAELREHWNSCAQCVVECAAEKNHDLLVLGKPEDAITIIVANEKFCTVVGGKHAMHGQSFGSLPIYVIFSRLRADSNSFHRHTGPLLEGLGQCPSVEIHKPAGLHSFGHQHQGKTGNPS